MQLVLHRAPAEAFHLHDCCSSDVKPNRYERDQLQPSKGIEMCEQCVLFPSISPTSPHLDFHDGGGANKASFSPGGIGIELIVTTCLS